MDGLTAPLFVMPQQRSQIVPAFGVAVEICHGVEHAGLHGFPTLVEQPHDRAPTNGGEDGEVAGVWGDRPDRR